MRKQLTYFNFLKLWFLGAFVSFVVQLTFPLWFAHLTNWAYSTGWQWEIAFWNVSVCIIVAITLYKRSQETAEILTKGFIVLSCLLVINHFLALLSHFAIGNFLAMTMNIFAIILGLLVVKINKK